MKNALRTDPPLSLVAASATAFLNRDLRVL
uniref:Uncharacterized protein n=1 Tax=Arundo donax TaxID=35708 RepID=A0A0A8ZAY2_ARUDO